MTTGNVLTSVEYLIIIVHVTVLVDVSFVLFVGFMLLLLLLRMCSNIVLAIVYFLLMQSVALSF